jgi:hypothetical protein
VRARGWGLLQSNDADANAASAARGRALLQSDTTREVGLGRERLFLQHSTQLQRARDANLRASGWLGRFRPIAHTCPLAGRKVAPETVAEFAAIAWHCDGLGFAWECLRLRPGRIITE